MKILNGMGINRSLHATAPWYIFALYAVAVFVLAVMTIFLFGSAMRGFDHGSIRHGFSYPNFS